MNQQVVDLEIIKTKDNSDSLFSNFYRAAYHSHHGAIQESLHVFIKQGFLNWIKCNPTETQVKIFELGFGTGLNAYLTLLANKDDKRSIKYYAAEKHPIPLDLAKKLNYHSFLENWNQEEFIKLHTSHWNQEVKINDFLLHKLQGDIEQINFTDKFNLVYYDAFSPQIQPLLWQNAIISKVTENMLPGAILVTYCCQGHFRRNLEDLHLKVSKVPGPPGKREMVIALKE